jgi:hypothetical protein
MGEKEQGSIGEDEARSPFFGGMPPPAEASAFEGTTGGEGIATKPVLVVDGIATKPVQVAFQRTSGHMGASDLASGDQGTVEDKQ